MRRAHLDRLCAALWPARAEARRRYGRALAQRNALLGRIRSGAASVDSLAAWERELAAVGVELIRSRREAVDLLAPGFAEAAAELCLPGAAALRYLPRSEAGDPEAAGRRASERRDTDLARGYTSHGPHLDELAVSLAGRPLRRYGSQGEQRAAVLALLFAERRALLEAGRNPPLMLLDDVMSELDASRRAQLAKRLAEGGQAVLTATEPDHLPGGCERAELALRQGERCWRVACRGRRRESPSLPRERPRLASPAGRRSAGARAHAEPLTLLAAAQSAWAGRRGRQSCRRSRAGGGARRRGDDRLPVGDLGAGAGPAGARAPGEAQRGALGGCCGARREAPVRALRFTADQQPARRLIRELSIYA